MPKAAPKRPAPRRQSSRELIFGDLWEFDPAPETADPKLKKRYDLFIGGKFTAPKSGKYFATISPGNESKLADIALAGAADVDAGVSGGAARAYDGVWGKMAGSERGKYIYYRIARLLAGSGARICRGGDDGRRQADQRIARLRRADGGGAFSSITRAGRTNSTASRRAAASRRSAWSGRSSRGIFPLLMLAWKNRARTGDGKLHRDQARRNHEHYGAEARGDFAGGRIAAGRGEHRRGRRRNRRGGDDASAGCEGRLHRLDGRGEDHHAFTSRARTKR